MRITTLFRRLLKVTHLVVQAVQLEDRGLVLSVRPSWRFPRCGGCGRRRPGYDRSPERLWRHLGWAEVKVWLAYAPRRVRCRVCGVRTEQVPWAEPGSRFTRDFEEMVAYLAQSTDQTKVTQLMGIAWSSVGAIVARVVATRLDPSRLDGLQRIGVDEFGYRRRQRYLTLVVDHDRRRVVWGSPGRSAESLRSFFVALGPERAARLACVTIVMSMGYLQAIREGAPQAVVVYDRFHVQRLATAAVDEVRRTLLRDLRGTRAGRELFHSRFALLKKPWDLTPAEKAKLADLQRHNAPLYRAYLLKEALGEALDYRQPARAERQLRRWLSWAARSRLRPFVRAARTIRQHLEGILAYVRERLTNGLAEGLNNRLRMVARRAFGFHSHEALMAMAYLCCGGVQLNPRLP